MLVHSKFQCKKPCLQSLQFCFSLFSSFTGGKNSSQENIVAGLGMQIFDFRFSNSVFFLVFFKMQNAINLAEPEII